MDTQFIYENQLNVIRADFQIDKELLRADFMSTANSSKRNAFFQTYKEAEQNELRAQWYSHMETMEENIPFFEWFEENILQVCTLTQRNWKTTRRGEVYSNHPPLEEVEFDNYYGEKVKASPLKNIPEGLEKGNPTLKDIKHIQHQNNYSNKVLSTIAT